MLRTCSAAALLLLAGCVTAPPPPAPPPPVAEAPRGPDASRFTALMINGGGSPTVNFQAHLTHLRELRALLLEGGIPSDRIALFSSDGADPAPDLVSREAQPEADFWRLHGTSVERRLETPRVLLDSKIPGAELRAATKAGIAAWFEGAKTRLGAGDVLLLYVTDHGLPGGRDPLASTILLWNKETLSVRELGAMIDGLDPGVRGRDAHVAVLLRRLRGACPRAALGARGVCGYYASTADRPAYGCFPENRGKEKAGHAFQFIHALAATRRLESAHAAVLVDDDTPDVPIRSSDVYLEDALARAARARGVTLGALADDLLSNAGATPEREVVQRIAASAGLPVPGKLADVEGYGKALPDLARRLEGSAKAWHAALGDANTGNLRDFVAEHPAWGPHLVEPSLGALDQPAARALTAALLAELAPWSRAAARAAARRSSTSGASPRRARRTAPRCASPPRSGCGRSSSAPPGAPSSRAPPIPRSSTRTTRSAHARTSPSPAPRAPWIPSPTSPSLPSRTTRRSSEPCAPRGRGSCSARSALASARTTACPKARRSSPACTRAPPRAPRASRWATSSSGPPAGPSRPTTRCASGP